MPVSIWRKAYMWVQTVGNVFGVKEMAEHIGQPIFQDPTWQGRLIGIGIRIVRLLVGLFAEGLFLMVAVVLVVAWFALPFVAIYGMVRL